MKNFVKKFLVIFPLVFLFYFFSGLNFAKAGESLVWVKNKTIPFEEQYYSVATSNKLLVTVGESGLIKTSQNGTLWTKVNSGITKDIYKVIWAGNKFVAVGKEGTILTSPDGLNWTSQTANVSCNLYDITWDGSKYVVVGSGERGSIEKGDSEVFGIILTSFNGIDWTQIQNLQVGPLYTIEWAVNKFMVAGLGDIFTSSDGINWTQITEVDNWIEDFVWNGSQYVAVGTDGTILTSQDGYTWNKCDLGSDIWLKSISWNGNYFVVVGYDGAIFVSSDGIKWTPKTNWTDRNKAYTDVLWDGYQFVIVGTWGTIITGVPNDIIKVKIDGKPLIFDVAPKVINGRTLVPLRVIFEALGTQIEWEESTQTISATKGKTQIRLKINSNDVIVNGVQKKLDVPATIINGRTFVPARFISESLGGKVQWDGRFNLVLITTK